MNWKWLQLVLLIGLPASLMAQVSFEITPRKVPLNRNLEFKVVVETNTSRNPSFPNGLKSAVFKLLSQSPNTSFSTQIINGQVNSRREFSYYFQPLKEGKYIFEKQVVNVGGKVYSSEPTEIEVVAPEQSVQSSRRSRSPFDDFFNSPFDSGRRSSRDPEIFAELSTPRLTYYQGEAIPVDIKLVFFGVEIHPQRSSLEWPTMHDFWIEEGAIPNQPARRVERNGKYYNESLVARRIVYANKSGKLTIDPAVFDLLVSTGGFMADWQQVRRKTKPVELNILPLPEKGRPDQFSGGVGHFQLKAEIDKSKLAVGDTLSLKVTLEGSGNFSAIQNLEMDQLKMDFDVFDGGTPLTDQDKGIVSKKTWVYALVPKQEGDFTIPPIQFSFFDLQTKSYKTVRTEPLSVHIDPGTRLPDQVTNGNDNKAAAVVEDKSLRFIHFEDSGWTQERKKQQSPVVFYYLIAFGFLFNFGFLAVRRLREQWMGKREELRPRLAHKNFKQGIRAMRKRINESSSGFYSDVSNMIMTYFGEKLGRPAQGLLLDEIERILLEKGAPEDLYANLVNCIETCDFARFTSSGDTSREKLLTQALDVVDRAEEVLK